MGAVMDNEPPEPERPPTPAPSPAPVRKPRTALWVTLAVIGVCGVCGIVAVSRLTGGSTSGTKSDTGAGGPNPAPQAMPGIGAPARDGTFEFTVRRVTCGEDQVGDGVTKTAAGQFCVVTVTVKNIGDKPQTFYHTSQQAYAANGNEYEPDWEASILALNDTERATEAINPGNQIEAVVVFDIPKDNSIQSLKLHDSALSNGVTIKVS